MALRSVRRAIFAVVLLASCAAAPAEDVYDGMNRLRTVSCGAAPRLAPLNVDARLERAAAALSEGGELGQALKGAGYRASRSAFIAVSGAPSEAQVVSIAQRDYCAQVADGNFADIGVHRGRARTFIVLAAPFAPRVAASPEAAGREVLGLVNEARRSRRSCGNTSFAPAGPLKWNAALAAAARVHAEDMARLGYFSHDGRDGSKPAERVARAGYRYRMTGENIAAGPTRAEDAVAGWIRSPPHCANLMQPAYTEMGAAYSINAASELGVYWAQEFGAPR